MYVRPLYLAGAYSTAVKAGFPVFPIASDPLFLRAVAAAARTRRTHTVVASREVHAHTVIPAGVCLQTALIDVWKTKSESQKTNDCVICRTDEGKLYSWTVCECTQVSIHVDVVHIAMQPARYQG